MGAIRRSVATGDHYYELSGDFKIKKSSWRRLARNNGSIAYVLERLTKIEANNLAESESEWFFACLFSTRFSFN